jgi:hypothetical protein
MLKIVPAALVAMTLAAPAWASTQLNDAYQNCIPILAAHQPASPEVTKECQMIEQKYKVQPQDRQLQKAPPIDPAMRGGPK